MNLINFLKEIDTLTEQYSTEQLGNAEIRGE